MKLPVVMAEAYLANILFLHFSPALPYALNHEVYYIYLEPQCKLVIPISSRYDLRSMVCWNVSYGAE